jgi:hypothetical protein
VSSPAVWSEATGLLDKKRPRDPRPYILMIWF